MLETVTCNNWEATFAAAHGGQLVRLRYLPLNRDILNYPESEQDYLTQPERFGIPVLFPPNRIAGGTFQWRGRTYSLPLNEPSRNNHLHGIVLHEPWQMSLTEDAPTNAATEIELSFTHHQGRKTFAGYPHYFHLSIRYRFETDTVIQTTTLENLDLPGSLPLPFTLGFHTAFLLPDAINNPPTLSIAARDCCYELDSHTRLPTGRTIPWPAEHEYYRDGGKEYTNEPPISCHCAAVTKVQNGQPFHGATLNFTAERLRITYAVNEAFGFWFLWSPLDTPHAICLEPMTSMVNAPNQSPLSTSVVDFSVLSPGTIWEATTRLELSEIT